MNKVDYMKPLYQRVKIENRTIIKRYGNKNIPTFEAMVRKLNK